MKLFGKWNWWLPEGLALIVRVEPSPLGEHRRPAPAGASGD
jgi:RND superfamily putative drug exporter